MELLRNDHPNFEDILRQVAVEGAVSVPILTEEARIILLGIAQGFKYDKTRLTITEVDSYKGSEGYKVHQDYQGCIDPCFDPREGGGFRDLRNAFQKRILEQAVTCTNPHSSWESCERTPFMDHLSLGVYYLQRYQPGTLGITPHQDSGYFSNIICLFNLGGKGRFYLCDDAAGNNKIYYDTTPGNVVIVRGVGLGGKGLEARPFHGAEDITEERYLFSLMQNSHELRI